MSLRLGHRHGRARRESSGDGREEGREDWRRGKRGGDRGGERVQNSKSQVVNAVAYIIMCVEYKAHLHGGTWICGGAGQVARAASVRPASPSSRPGRPARDAAAAAAWPGPWPGPCGRGGAIRSDYDCDPAFRPRCPIANTASYCLLVYISYDDLRDYLRYYIVLSIVLYCARLILYRCVSGFSRY